MTSEKRTVTVLQDDIDSGERKSGDSCAIARAVRRDLADLGEFRPVVSIEAVRLWEGDDTITWEASLPSEAMAFVVKFDERQRVEPFKFDLELWRVG